MGGCLIDTVDKLLLDYFVSKILTPNVFGLVKQPVMPRGLSVSYERLKLHQLNSNMDFIRTE